MNKETDKDNYLKSLQDIDRDHIWHPYSAMNSNLPIYQVDSANGVYLNLSDGRQLIDGMSSWWSVIHGYNHPQMNDALSKQLTKMSHVMFGGLTHEPAILLAQKLLELTPSSLQKVFFSDSGSVAVEVAMKMAIQYWHSQQEPQRKTFVSLRNAYHGDTFAAMSVCDPDTGMHSLFQGCMPKQLWVDQPRCRFGEPCADDTLNSLKELFINNNTIAAMIIEPIVQGVGGMWFYSAEYLKKVRKLCNEFGILLIADEIATGFGRTGKMFACEHANVSPDIMCVGKSLTAGYMSLAATLTTKKISDGIDSGSPGIFMHGPTFMANPLACAAALSSIDLLIDSDWVNNIARIEKNLVTGLSHCELLDSVVELRVMGAIAVLEMKKAVNMKSITQAFVDQGVWVRPFGRLVYLMPPYIISNHELAKLCVAVSCVLANPLNY
ncbi:Adenosylmethionine-8-amino-7-oxononanoate aminotransferase [hydrothermal vent metagenome]|uniref:Adenosylmethionine-8-amino-7-oxononanoate aminotransferase n=1 Tax=hydrothermal vent metagenome TaxID=652676 RepID=A0A3B0YPB6_9ZZZZ